jgi:CheY-like chemotaxis protein
LSTVFGIVQQSGANVYLYSEPGHGTTFKIYFPMTSERSEETDRKRPNARLASGFETVLVVEDQDAVRDLIRSVLTRAGYTVLAARDGSEALRLCESHTGHIHLVITDLVMPQMNGRELAERIALLRPQIKLLFISGYTDDTVRHHGILDVQAFLQKPFTPATLTEKVGEVLAVGTNS